MDLRTPSMADVRDAQQRLAGIAVRTPLLRADALDRRLGLRLYVKAENLQHSGAFKFRGAYNCLSRLTPAEHPGGVVAYSTGNHGQAIATVARMLGLKATIVMPADAPRVKIAKAERQGAEVVTYDRATQRREDIAARISRERGALIVPPGDHPDVIAGQGTAALEALQDLPGGVTADVLAVPCGGGGLAAGTCLAVDAHGTPTAVWAAEPEAFDDTRRSLAAGQRMINPALTGSICDALLAPTPAELPFSINRQKLAGVLTAPDECVRQAMGLLFDELRIVAEPGGAMAVAGLLQDPRRFAGRTVVAIVSGGNIDRPAFVDALQAA
ncbi:Threonine dehydratase, catabolic [Bordetella sputigena]|uniref:threonine ammonia-lyase n=1 Tax=Bordetella sputigena TaxID=1416810 RepID=UPI0039EF325D